MTMSELLSSDSEARFTLQSMRGFGFENDVKDFEDSINNGTLQPEPLIELDDLSDKSHVNVIVTNPYAGNIIYRFFPLVHAARKKDRYVFRTTPSLITRLFETRSELEVIDLMMNYTKIVFHKFNLLSLYPSERVAQILIALDNVSFSSHIVFLSCLGDGREEYLNRKADDITNKLVTYLNPLSFVKSCQRFIM